MAAGETAPQRHGQTELPRERRRRSKLGLRPAPLILLAWALLLAAWVVGNPPFAAPDEYSHYIRAVGIGEGHLIGRSDPSAEVGADARQVHWTRQAARLVTLPAGLDPTPYACQMGEGSLSASCLEQARRDPSPVTLVTTVGNYQPLAYLLPAAAMGAASVTPDALRLGRAAGAVVAFALLALALLALYDDDRPTLSIAGLLLAASPMVLFCASILNGSGLEIAASIAFFACLLRLVRPRPASSSNPPSHASVEVARRWWSATAVSGFVLALARPAGPVWLCIALCLACLFAWRGGILRPLLLRREAWALGGVLALGVGLNRAWEALYGSHVSVDLSSLHAGLVAGFHEWWAALPQLVGSFGYVDVNLPLALPLLWFALTVGLLVVAGSGVRGWRPWVAPILALVAVLVLPPIFYALLLRPTGYGLQGRDMLPGVALLPLLAGELCYLRRFEIATAMRRALLLLPVGVAVTQAGAWCVDAHRFAVGSEGPLWFPASATWSPPIGWALPIIAVVVGAALLAAVGFGGDGQRHPSTSLM